MPGEIREVSAPETAAPQHQLSEIGQQRLAALTEAERAPSGLFPTREQADAEREANTVTDEDGNVANLEDGSLKMAEPKIEVDMDAIPELAVPADLAPTAQIYREDVAAIAADYPAMKDEVATLFEFIGQAAVRDHQRDAKDGMLAEGTTAGPTLWNEHECLGILSQRYGHSQAQTIVREAQQHWQSLPDSVKQWLDADMGAGARLGNHPDVVVGLALRSYAQMSPERARAELIQIRAGKDYGKRTDPLEQDKLHLLNIIAARGQQPPQGSPFPTRDAGTPTSTVSPMVPKNSIRARLDAINADPDLMSADATKRGKLVRERAALMAKLAGEA
jgi:hypothetical protein